jgi:hypothetical protein
VVIHLHKVLPESYDNGEGRQDDDRNDIDSDTHRVRGDRTEIRPFAGEITPAIFIK